ncbi:Rne/Rng family ribonuclease [Parvularcula sp. LCG005]|uniref:Rne/Rng family ribonuclease n=1 Tax=Parvularcula sp. LCG005 TaxID=3078805 RepID=UPI0029424916|nr:Rne/Rng family ribonuclease [Parvularcula sp. LCG005]WOI52107.1 Rne/Rng family ribonuclease [Parvularcula sp. LCG005]
MSKKMLIDARHREETRVALLSGGKVEDFDFESLARKPLRGNIYLARITRVEPSLQAAFVEYGGNRHGFLAFSEIHPDYYQIPVSDRQVLRDAEALEAELAEKLAEYDQAPADLDDDDDSDDDNDTRDTAEASSDNDGDETVEAKSERPRRGRRRRRRGGRGRDSDDSSSASDDQDDNADEAVTAEASSSDEDAGEDTTAKAVPPDYAGEDSAEEPGWHGLEEEVCDTVAEADTGASEGETTDGDEPTGDDDDKPRSIGLEGEDEPTVTKELDDVEPVEGSATDIALPDGYETTAEDAEAERKEQIEAREDDADDDDSADDSDESDSDNAVDEATAKERAKEIADLERRYNEAKRARDKVLRDYRIQEVIKRRQILLVQVVKEERGNKGAALTTYMSLAGRYGVLMPNNARGGGVSRKITNAGDRKRLRNAIKELKVPQGQGLIIRTAGAKRTKAEIKRDYDYLARLWDTIREQTMKSIAPALIYEEASLIKRAIRDLYDKDTGEIIVEGEEGYREAKDFMKMLMPSHAKNVQPHRDTTPLFLRYGVEQQLDEMYRPTVTLKSGGYIVIQQTEALISIDVNSGKATKERNVEATALKTNSEAAVEVARQCRLRDLAGLVVVDFIDMEENRNNRAVEKKLKDAMKIDRARTQIGSISNFGLLEMSRQRRRSGIVDGTTRLCPTCEGAGAVRSVEMAALRILRSVEEAAVRDRAGMITVTTSHEVAIYILNQKRSWLNRIEDNYQIVVEVMSDHDKSGDQFDITKRGKAPELESLRQETIEEPVSDDTPDDTASSDDDSDDETSSSDEEQDGRGRKRRRRRRGRRDDTESRRDDQSDDSSDKASDDDDGDASSSSESDDDSGDVDDEGKPKKRRRRGRRGGRRSRKSDQDGNNGDDADGETGDSDQKDDSEPVEKAAAADASEAPVAKAKTEDDAGDATEAKSAEADDASAAKKPATRKPRKSRAKPKPADAGDETTAEKPAAVDAKPAEKPAPEKSAEAQVEPLFGQSEPAPAPARPSIHGPVEEIKPKPASEKRRAGWWSRALGKGD